MTNYARVRTLFEASEATDYTPPLRETQASYSWSPARIEGGRDFFAGVTGSARTFYTSNENSIPVMLVQNLNAAGTANGEVYVSYWTTKASKTFLANKISFVDSNPDTITDADSTFFSALQFVGSAWLCGDYAVVSGATNAANNGTFLVQTAAAGTLTLSSGVTLTAAAPDAAVVTIQCRRLNVTMIPAGGYAIICSPVCANNITFQTNPSAPATTVRLFYGAS